MAVNQYIGTDTLLTVNISFSLLFVSCHTSHCYHSWFKYCSFGIPPV